MKETLELDPWQRSEGGSKVDVFTLEPSRETNLSETQERDGGIAKDRVSNSPCLPKDLSGKGCSVSRVGVGGGDGDAEMGHLVVSGRGRRTSGPVPLSFNL